MEASSKLAIEAGLKGRIGREPVEVFKIDRVITAAGGARRRESIAEVSSIDDARRIVACVNACEGLTTESVEDCTRIGGLKYIDQCVVEQGNKLRTLTTQRDELQAELDRIRSNDNPHDSARPFLEWRDEIGEAKRLKRIAELQRDQLLAALEHIASSNSDSTVLGIQQYALAAIDAAKGGAA